MNNPLLIALVCITMTCLLVLTVFATAIIILQYADRREAEKMVVTAKSLNAIFEDEK